MKLKLPYNFTVCSAIRRDNLYVYGFFTLLGENKNEPFLSALMYDDSFENCDFQDCVSHLCYKIGGQRVKCPKQLPIFYPNEWVHSCMSLSTNTSSAHVVWVVQGTVVENKTVKTDGNQPNLMADRVILGKLSKKHNLQCVRNCRIENNFIIFIVPGYNQS